MTTKQAMAFSLRVNGLTYEQIAKQTGWSEYSLRKYFSLKGKWHTEYETWSHETIGLIEKDTRMRIKRDLAKAMTVLEYALTLVKTNPSLALRAAEEILDRGGLCGYERSTDNQNTGEDVAEKIMRWYENR